MLGRSIEKIVQAASNIMRWHMKGNLNYKILAKCTSKNKQKVRVVKPCNFLQKSTACWENINVRSLPGGGGNGGVIQGESIEGRDGYTLQ